MNIHFKLTIWLVVSIVQCAKDTAIEDIRTVLGPVHVVPEVSLFSAGGRLLPLTGLGLLVGGLGPGILVHATSSGDLATVQAYLENNPHQVYCTLCMIYSFMKYLYKCMYTCTSKSLELYIRVHNNMKNT